ncbi:Transcriptional regulator, contains XRE-family HTH domain [Asanoa hainanensis]|uniref:Transcriptional regulator, contains XRE-family HTH domain n=2 Tax=Asanoa hainanensis TaxID=560556 RepID=A0A239P8N6_9ACTN|nr:Transcriptional regulator, contains XRE-family HTH domain [Asanoa hainanensis]
MPPIGERLRQARLDRGMTVRGLARVVDTSASLISQIETGKSNPSVSTLYAITAALGISVEDIFNEPEAGAPRPAPAPVVTNGDLTGNSATAQGLRMLAQRRRVGPVVPAGEREVLHLDSGVTWELLGQLPDTHVDFLRITYAPGGSSSGAGVLMRHSGTEWGHVLSGQLTLTLGFDTHVLDPGDSVSFDCSTPHSYANHGVEPAVGIWFVAERFS